MVSKSHGIQKEKSSSQIVQTWTAVCMVCLTQAGSRVRSGFGCDKAEGDISGWLVRVYGSVLETSSSALSRIGCFKIRTSTGHRKCMCWCCALPCQGQRVVHDTDRAVERVQNEFTQTATPALLITIYYILLCKSSIIMWRVQHLSWSHTQDCQILVTILCICSSQD